MINECEEPPSFSDDALGGQAELDSQPGPAKATRPYAGADDSMSETLGTTNLIQNQSPSKMPKPELLVGDLVWSKIPGHAWWPSMVSYEPNKAVYFQSSGRGKTCFKYHVQFFGDEPQRGWVSDKNMIKFTGRDPSTDPPNSMVFKRDKIPHSKQLRAWERALEQAQKALPLNRQQRKLCYVFKYNDDLQKAPKQSKSPEPAGRKKEKASKKTGKVRSRLTRRSCLLDRPKDIMNEADYFDDISSIESLAKNFPVIPSDGNSQSADLKGDVKRENTPEKVTLRRRGRSAGKLSINGSIVFDSVQLHKDLKQERKSSKIVPFSKPDVNCGEFVSIDKAGDLKLTDEKVEMSTMSTKFRAKGLSRKRPREHVKDPIMKAAKKIKVEIVSRKHNVFEIIPKKMKNKQTQTPERKTKKGVMTKKKIKRKLEMTRNSIKTKETFASKKFSRKLKGEDVSTQKGMTKKVLLERKKIRKRGKREASSICTQKQAVKEKKAPTKKSRIGLAANCSDDVEYTNVNESEANNIKISIADEKEVVVKRKRGRPRKVRKADESTKAKNIKGTALSGDPLSNSAVKGQSGSNLKEGQSASNLKEGQSGGNHKEEQSGSNLREGQSASNLICSVVETQLSASTDQKSTNKAKGMKKILESGIVEKKESRGKKIGLTAGLVSSSKQAKMPSRRSTRHCVASSVSEANHVVVCKVSQLPEIDDIVDNNSEENSGVNGLTGYLNKGLLLEVLSDIHAQIPIELEETKEQPPSVSDSSDTNGESSSVLVTEANSAHIESGLSSVHDPLLEATDSLNKHTICTAANTKSVDEIGLNSGKKQFAEAELQVHSDEHLSACSIPQLTNNQASIENTNLIVHCNSKFNIELAQQDAECESYSPVPDKAVLCHDPRQTHQHSSVGDTEMHDLHHPVVSHSSMGTTDEIVSSIEVNAPRTFNGSHHLERLINDEQRHDYLSNEGHRGDENAIFPANSLSHVEAADVYLNDDDVGLPVSKDSRSYVLTSCSNDSLVAPNCKDGEHSSTHNEVSNTDIQFGKASINNGLDGSGLEEFQPSFAIPSLSLPDLVQTTSYYQRRLDNPCSAISTIPNTNTDLQYIHSKYFPMEEAFAESLTPQASTQTVSPTPHLISYRDPLSGTNSVTLPSRGDCSHGLGGEGHCKTGVDINSKAALVGSNTELHVDNENIFENLSRDVGAHAIDHMQEHLTSHDVAGNHGVNDDKSDLLPIKGMIHDLVTSQSVPSHGDNVEVGNSHCEQSHKQLLHPSDRHKMTGTSFNGRKSPLNSQPVVILGEELKKSPAVIDPVPREEPGSSDDNDATKTHSFIDFESNEVPELDSNTVSANSSISERQSPSEGDNGMDSAKVADDLSQAGNSLKRQRKRKAMSDFHVGLAFDEILSNRGRASDGDKGASKLSLAKKKRDSIKKVDYEERTKVNKDGDSSEQIPLTGDISPKDTVQSQGKSEEVKRPGCKKRSSSISAESAVVGGLDFTQLCCDGKPVGVSNEVSSIEETVVCAPGVSPVEAALATEATVVKKKRGRKPKVKDGKEKGLQASKYSQQNTGISDDIVKGTTENTPDPVVKVGAEGLEKKSVANKAHKKQGRGRPPKLKMNSDEAKPKRKYVRRKGTKEDKLSGNVDLLLSEKEKNKEAPQTELSVELKEDKSSILEAIEQEAKPKRRYKKKVKTMNNTAGELGSRQSRKLTRKYEKKSAKKRKREALESLDDSNVTNSSKEKVKGKKKSSRAKSNPALSEQTEVSLLAMPKKYKKKTLLQSKKDQNVEEKKKSKSKKVIAPLEDTVDESMAPVACIETALETESITEANVVVDKPQRPPLPLVDSKKNKQGEKLETRSNISDETASISGKEADEYGKSKKENICTICEQSDGLLTCNGVCYSSFHPDCLGLSTVPEKFFCDECLTRNHSCFLCKETGDLRKCSYPMCGKFYHDVCTQKMRGCKLDSNKLICPLHNCGTCTNDKESASASKKRLLRCVRCPTAYHASRCLVAGCVQLTSSLMVCNRHFVPQKSKPHHTHYNVSWCFLCSTGGMLVCCDTCPAAFHPGCVEELNGVPDETWQCDSCREGKRPLYGDLVWVKYGFWRWWPARICFPDEIPTRIQNLAHDVGEFPVMFFGSRDYCWLHAGRVFPYQEGDKGCRGSSKNGTNKIFEKAIREVEEAHKELKEMHDKQLEQRLAKQSKKPPPYKQIKVNKYISALRNVNDSYEFTHCECLQTSENPCGPGSECINRMLQIECDKTCRAQDKCQNQRFQRCQQVDCVPLKTAHCGWGLKTRQAIKKGDFVIEYVGELIDETTCRKRINDYHDQGISDYYFLVIDKDNIIDAYPKGNASRFMNHCCDPNCDTQKWTVNGEIRVGLFANKDIEAGSELTFNYNLDTLGNEKKACRCGSKNCSGFLGVRPKTQTAIALKEKKKKEKQKKKKKKDKTKMIRHEDECFACGDGGELIMCDRTSCSKCYHLKCLTLPGMPKGKWDCPWHFCDVCGKRATYYCSICPNSFCGPHHEGQVMELSEGVYVCDEHTQDEIKEEENRLRTKMTDRTSTSVQIESTPDSSAGKT